MAWENAPYTLGQLGSGGSELVWRNIDPVTGNLARVGVWSPNGSGGYNYGDYVVGNEAGKGPWVLQQQVANFGGFSGRDDLWFTRQTGTIRDIGVWTMNDQVRTGSALVGSYDTTQWSFAGISDKNGDGRRDFVFSEVGTGRQGVWLMGADGLTPQYQGYFPA